jgi:hypothetical protein
MLAVALTDELRTAGSRVRQGDDFEIAVLEATRHVMPIEIKSWDVLPSEGGESIALDGERMAVGGTARLCVWQGRTRLATVVAQSPAPGPPRFFGEFVYWGPGFLDLASDSYTLLEGAQTDVRPGGGERPLLYAWSPRGERFLGSFSTGDPQRPVRVTLFCGQTGNVVATLWKGSGLPPQSAWLGDDVCVVGFGDPRVFDHSGKHLADIALGGATISCLLATTGERRLIVIDLNRSVALIDTETWAVLDRWCGPWLHGAVSPDGRFVTMLEPWGKLHFACLEGDRFEPVGLAAIDPKAIGVAVTPDEVATVGGGEVGRAELSVECPTGPAP